MSPAAWPPRRLRRLGRSRASGESPEPGEGGGRPGLRRVGLLAARRSEERPGRAAGAGAGRGRGVRAGRGRRRRGFAQPPGEPSPGSSSRLRSKHGGGGVRGPWVKQESGATRERERGAGLRRRCHAWETTPTGQCASGCGGPGELALPLRWSETIRNPKKRHRGSRLPPPQA